MPQISHLSCCAPLLCTPLRDDGRILVPPAGKVNDYDFISVQFGREPYCISHGMGALQGGDDPLAAGKAVKGADGLFVPDRNVFCPPRLVEIAVLGADSGVIQSGRYGIGVTDLAVAVLEQVRLVPVQDSYSAG